MAGAALRVEGLRALVRDLSKVEGAVAELRQSMQRIGTFVIDRSIPRTRRDTGRLASSYRAGRAKGVATVRNPLRYAAIQEFGWPKHNIRPSLAVTGTIRDNEDDLINIVRTELDDITRRFNT